MDALLAARERLITELHSRLTADDRAFLLSVKNKTPDWSLLGLKGIGDLPAVKWKLINLARMTPDKHEAAVANLQAAFTRGGKAGASQSTA